jgi:hypothetical protein
VLKGTVTGHYLVFLEKTMDEIDCLPEMKGHYIVMDNAFIHTAKEIDELIREAISLFTFHPVLQSSTQSSSFGQ